MTAPSAHSRIVVFGGGYAGLTAAARLGEMGGGADVVLVDAKAEFVERIRLHEIAGGTPERRLPYRDFLADRGVAFVQARIGRLDRGRRMILGVAPDGRPLEIAYDLLVYAPGSATDLTSVSGAAGHAVALDSPEAAHALRKAAGAARRVLVVGGGLTAVEAASELAERMPHLRVALAPGGALIAAEGPGGISAAGIAHLRATFERLGISLIEGGRVARLSAKAAEFSDGRTVDFDLCVWACGFRPPALARESGIAVNGIGQIQTDVGLRSISHPDIIAIGDAAAVVAEPGGRCRMSCAAGRPMGAAAAQAVTAILGGGVPAAFGFGYTFRCVSLGREDGLIQFVDPQDRPRPIVWTGARAARWKEYVCRRTLAGIGLDPNLGPPPDTPPAPDHQSSGWPASQAAPAL